MEDIEIGEYVRDVDGLIFKVDNIDILSKDGGYIWYEKNLLRGNWAFNIVKHSKNIIDLIEVGDYVNGKKVVMDLKQSKNWYESKDNFITCKGYTFEENEIKSIVTKEQFKSMEYIVEEE